MGAEDSLSGIALIMLRNLLVRDWFFSLRLGGGRSDVGGDNADPTETHNSLWTSTITVRYLIEELDTTWVYIYITGP